MEGDGRGLLGVGVNEKPIKNSWERGERKGVGRREWIKKGGRGEGS